jgi:hypothetical protein
LLQEGILVVMSNLYHNVAVASIFMTLSFTLEPSEEVKAATITLTPTIQFGIDTNFGPFDISYDSLSPRYDTVSNVRYRYTPPTKSRLAEFNISNFFLAPNTTIRSAVFQDKISSVSFAFGGRSAILGIFGYVGNGTAKVSALERGVFLSSVDISSSSRGDTLNFDVTAFVNQQVSNGYPFAGFAMQAFYSGPYTATFEGTDAFGRSSLVIETADVPEPVPEPTTIFGSALALSVGGWLKRKKSGQENKTTPQN